MYIFLMRKPFEAKFMRVQETVADVRETSRRVGNAAESQATLNVALTAVAVTALLVAVILVRHVAREAGQ